MRLGSIYLTNIGHSNMPRKIVDISVPLENDVAADPPGFTASRFPVKVRGGSAGWTRAVAILDV